MTAAEIEHCHRCRDKPLDRILAIDESSKAQVGVWHMTLPPVHGLHDGLWNYHDTGHGGRVL